MNPNFLCGWGERSLDFEFSLMSVRVTGLNEAQHISLKKSYPVFTTDVLKNDGVCAFECKAYKLQHPPVIPMAVLDIDGLYTPYKTHRNNRIHITGYNFEACIELRADQPRGGIGVVDEFDFAKIDVIDNFLRIYTAHKALELGGVVLHSAGLVFEGQAYIFSGRSNAGKTTLTRKAYQQGARVLSDDINLLLPSENGYEAHAVPFTGEFGRTLQHENGQKSYPVAGVVLLEQADQLETSVVRPSCAVARLLTGSPFVNTDPEESAALFDVLTALVEKVPVIKLRSRRDDAIEKIMDAVKSEFNHA